jgi:hypothetical protein
VVGDLLKLIAKEYLASPGLCTLCESSPVDNEPMVDTNRDLQLPVVHKLRGRKYVCPGCIIALGAVIGLVTDAKQKAALADKDAALAELNALKDRVVRLTSELVDVPSS